MEANAHPKLAASIFAVGAGLAVVRIAVASAFFQLPQGTGALGDFAICLAGAASLWAVISVHLLPDDRHRPLLIIDGLTAVAAVGWCIALLPFRSENYLSEGAADELVRAYLPMALLSTPVMLLLRKGWPAMNRKALYLRWAALTGVLLAVTWARIR